MMTSKDLLLSVGQKVAAIILGAKYELSICGWRDNEFILTDVPRFRGDFMRMAAFTGIQIRFVKEGHVMAFKTRVILAHSHPPPYMLIEFPESLEKDNMRKHERYKVKFPITYKKDGETLASSIFDVSLGGALITHTRPLVYGETIRIDAEVKEIGATLTNQEATVQNVRENVQGKKGLCVSGVMFWNIPEKNQQSLQKIIDCQIKEGKS